MNSTSLWLTGSIFIVSCLFCYIPALFTNTKYIRKIYPYISIGAAGFLLSVMLNDFIPHITSSCHSTHTHKGGSHAGHHHSAHKGDKHNDHSLIGTAILNFKNQIGLIVGGLTFICLLATDYLILQHHHCETEQLEKHKHEEHGENKIGTCNIDALLHTTTKAEALIFIFSLSLHSFFEGLAFKPSSQFSSLEVGIILHKLLESLTLGFLLHTSKFTRPFIALLISVYSILTPLGIIIAAAGEIPMIIRRIFDGMAFGSILFVVCIEMIPPSFHSQDRSVSKIILLFLAYVFTTIALGFTHKHG